VRREKAEIPRVQVAPGWSLWEDCSAVSVAQNPTEIALLHNNPNNTKSSHNGNSDRRESGLWVLYDGFVFSVQRMAQHGVYTTVI